ncbi:hypothetical protein FRX31_027944 [Thalictrum thalictroides]|uniref:Uncharacterized protein n=1 Tax=Thalictrum thalictroides TaxID=46969 RepID=A0A7J6VCZ4_THATH|nr:hypothetical protein FRX31_027944 [Thalictrum thalictroides]
MASAILCLVTARGGGGRGCLRQSINLVKKLQTGRHRKMRNAICPMTPPVTATMAEGSMTKTKILIG